MYAEKSWVPCHLAGLVLLILFLTLYSGCATMPNTTTKPTVVDVVIETQISCGTFAIDVGWVDINHAVYLKDGKWFMMTRVFNGRIQYAWLDMDGNGTVDLEFENQEDLLEKYPHPCDPLRGTES